MDVNQSSRTETEDIRDISKFYETLGSTLGTGGYATAVKLVQSKQDNKLYAVKQFNINDLRRLSYVKDFSAMRNQIRHELNMLKALDDNNCPGSKYVVCAHEVFEDKRNQTIYLIMDYIQGEELGVALNMLRSITAYDTALFYNIVLQLLYRLLLGLDFIHSKGVVHNDIKESNILVSVTPSSAKMQDLNESNGGAVRVTVDYKPVFVDFGLSCQIGNRECLRIGAVLYVAPERIVNVQTQEYSPATPNSDVWGLGMTILACLLKTHKNVYEFLGYRETGWETKFSLLAFLQKIKVVQKLKTPNHILNNAIAMMLEPDPVKRSTAKDIIDYLERGNVGTTEAIGNAVYQSPADDVTYDNLLQIPQIPQLTPDIDENPILLDENSPWDENVNDDYIGAAEAQVINQREKQSDGDAPFEQSDDSYSFDEPYDEPAIENQVPQFNFDPLTGKPIIK